MRSFIRGNGLRLEKSSVKGWQLRLVLQPAPGGNSPRRSSGLNIAKPHLRRAEDWHLEDIGGSLQRIVSTNE